MSVFVRSTTHATGRKELCNDLWMNALQNTPTMGKPCNQAVSGTIPQLDWVIIPSAGRVSISSFVIHPTFPLLQPIAQVIPIHPQQAGGGGLIAAGLTQGQVD